MLHCYFLRLFGSKLPKTFLVFFYYSFKKVSVYASQRRILRIVFFFIRRELSRDLHVRFVGSSRRRGNTIFFGFFCALQELLHAFGEPMAYLVEFAPHLDYNFFELVDDFLFLDEIDRFQRRFVDAGSLTHIQNVAIHYLVGSSEANRETSCERG